MQRKSFDTIRGRPHAVPSAPGGCGRGVARAQLPGLTPHTLRQTSGPAAVSTGEVHCFLVLFAPEALTAGGVAAPRPVIVSLPPAVPGNPLFTAMLPNDRSALGRFHPTTVKVCVVAVHVLIIQISTLDTWDRLASLVLLIGRRQGHSNRLCPAFYSWRF
jgi:hypothetical protein